jgi:hypothetical protein
MSLQECLKAKLVGEVEAQDKAGCFAGCGGRNTTNPCWIGCFFDTVLGSVRAARASATACPSCHAQWLLVHTERNQPVAL